MLYVFAITALLLVLRSWHLIRLRRLHSLGKSWSSLLCHSCVDYCNSAPGRLSASTVHPTYLADELCRPADIEGRRCHQQLNIIHYLERGWLRDACSASVDDLTSLVRYNNSTVYQSNIELCSQLSVSVTTQATHVTFCNSEELGQASWRAQNATKHPLGPRCGSLKANALLILFSINVK